MTIRFTSADAGSFLVLPFQTNHTVVRNLTDYVSQPKNGFWQLLLEGDFIYQKTTPFIKLLSAFGDVGATNFRNISEFKTVEGANYNHRHDSPKVIDYNVRERRLTDGSNIVNISERAEANMLFSETRSQFSIDPASDVRVVARYRRGQMIYTAELFVCQERGMSNLSPVEKRTRHIFTARAAYNGEDPLESRL